MWSLAYQEQMHGRGVNVQETSDKGKDTRHEISNSGDEAGETSINANVRVDPQVNSGLREETKGVHDGLDNEESERSKSIV